MDVLCRTGQARRGAPLRHCLPFLHGSPGTKLRQLVSAACRFGQRTRSTYALRVGCNTGSQEACLGAAAPTWHVRWLQDQWVHLVHGLMDYAGSCHLARRSGGEHRALEEIGRCVDMVDSVWDSNRGIPFRTREMPNRE